MKRSLAVLLFLQSAWQAMCQYPLVRSFEVRAGQHRPHITAIAQDDRGLLWAASDLGLLRTDGDQVDIMWRGPSERIIALAAISNEAVFVSDHGAIVRCGALGCDTVLQDTVWARTARSIIAVPGKGFVIGTYGHGVAFVESGKATMLDRQTGLPDDHINGLVRLPDGRIAVATDQGVAVIKDRTVQMVMDEPAGAPDNLTLCLDVDAAGTLWAGTDRAGVFSWKPEPGARPRTLGQSWSLGAVEHVRVTGTMVWAATREAGPVVIDMTLEQGTYRLDWSEHAEVGAFMRDLDGSLWWCDGSDVLHRADPAFLVVPEHEGLDLRAITAICADAKQSIWFATASGIYRHVTWFSEERKVSRVPVDIDLRTPVVSLAAAPDGTIWAGTFGSGVYAIGPEGDVRHYTANDGLSNDNVLSVRSTIDGVLFATLEGVTRFDAMGFHQSGKEAGFVFDVIEQGDRLFMATDGKGVMIDRPGFPPHTELDPGTYYSLLRAGDGTVWAIGPGTGFCSVTETGAGCFAAEQAPFDGEVFALGEVSERLIAFGSTGVTAFDPRSGAVSDVTAAFGLRDITAELNAVATDHLGALWLACDAGLVRMRPKASHFEPRLPVSFLEALVNGERQPAGDGITTSHDRNALQLRFTAPYWADPGAVRFQYRLLGYSERIEETRDRRVSFAYLSPGTYTFQVRAVLGLSGGGGAWTELPITVQAPWWRIPWVMGLFILLGGAVAFLLIRARDRRMRFRDRMEQEKVRFQLDALRSQVDPHFLFNSFNALVELIESDPPGAVQHVEQLSTFFRNILQVRDRERISMKEELLLLRNYFDLELRRFGSQISLAVDVDEAALHRTVVPLTLQMLVENALKHNVVSGIDPFVISVRADSSIIEVSNPIRARSTPPRSTGFGLESIRKRYTALTSRPIQTLREGESFIVRIPLLDPLA